MKMLELRFGGNMLTKEQMKNVVGGGTCCWHTADWSISQCGLSQSDAQSGASGGDLWCCDSCDSSRQQAIAQ